MPSHARTQLRCNVPSICTRSRLRFLLLTYMINIPASLLSTSICPCPSSDSTTPDQPYRSKSMTRTDRQPLQNTPMARRIVGRHNNRYGAVLSALWSFWYSREVATRHAARTGAHQDTYSVVLFSATTEVKEIHVVAIIGTASDFLYRSLSRTTLLALQSSWSSFF